MTSSLSVLAGTPSFGGRIGDAFHSIKQFSSTSGNSQSSLLRRLGLWVLRPFQTYRNAATVTMLTPADDQLPVFIENSVYIHGTLYVYGKAYTISDARAKTVLHSITESDLDALMTLNPMHFQYRRDAAGTLHMGVLAQDVQARFPHMVHEAAGFGPAGPVDGPLLAVDYIQFIPLLIAKTQHLQRQLDALKSGGNMSGTV